MKKTKCCIALALSIIISFGMYGADAIDKAVVTQCIRNRDFELLKDWDHMNFSDLFSTPVVTQFPTDSITNTIGNNQKNQMVRTLADEAVEQALSDSKNVVDIFTQVGRVTWFEKAATFAVIFEAGGLSDRSEDSWAPYALTLGAVAYLTKRQLETYQHDSLAIVCHLVKMENVQFNPSKKALEKQLSSSASQDLQFWFERLGNGQSYRILLNGSIQNTFLN